jgi:hypothetical protein
LCAMRQIPETRCLIFVSYKTTFDYECFFVDETSILNDFTKMAVVSAFYTAHYNVISIQSILHYWCLGCKWSEAP